MSKIRYKSYTTKGEYSVIYSGIRGIDASGDGSGISRSRLALSENMYRDYEGDDCEVLESIPGYRQLFNFPDRIKNLFLIKRTVYDPYIVVHSGDRLYLCSRGTLEEDGRPICDIHFGGERAEHFSAGKYSFFFNGEECVYLSEDGRLRTLSSDTPELYIPKTYINGAANEPRNLLSDMAYEEYIIGSADSMSFGTPELKYVITDTEAMTCRVSGISEDIADVYIPNRVLLGDSYYSVTEIGRSAFSGNAFIQDVYVAEGVRVIDKLAFSECQSLSTVSLPSSLSEIGNGAFAMCIALEYIRIGIGLRSVGSSVFSLCSSLSEIAYEGDEEELSKITNISSLSGLNITFGNKREDIHASLPLFGGVSSVESLTLGESELDYSEVYKDGLVSELKFYLDDKSLCEGGKITALCRLSESSSPEAGFIGSSLMGEATPFDIISSCKHAAVYDGRPFIGGSPLSPQTVFFATRDINGTVNPFYFSEYDYFSAPTGGEVVGLLPTGEALAVFSSLGGKTTLSYHTRQQTGIDRVPIIYTLSSFNEDVGEVYGAINFLDDPVFLSKRGLLGIDKKQLNLQRAVTVRSGNINRLLLSEYLPEARLLVWCGYLAVVLGETVFLADSRATFHREGGGLEYEWFMLKGIGSYRYHNNVYRYASVSPYSDYEVCYDKADTAIFSRSKIFSATDPLGNTLYYTTEGDKKYLLYKTPEMYGGDFYIPTAAAGLLDIFVFGTRCGDLCIFNNDMRGVPPTALTSEDGFDYEGYRKKYGRRISAEHYSFMGHPVRYAIKTAFDNGDIPHLEKSTVKHSLTVKCRSHTRGKISCEVATNSSEYREVCDFSSSVFSFDDLDFSSLALTCEDSYTRAIEERERGWVEKQITLCSEEYSSPIAIYNIAYRFYIKGRIKNKIFK